MQTTIIMSFARGAARFAGRAVRCAQKQHRAAGATGRSTGAAGVGHGRPHTTAQQTQRPTLLRSKRDSLGRRQDTFHRAEVMHVWGIMRINWLWLMLQLSSLQSYDHLECPCSFPGTRRPLMTQLPAALQRSLAWQATLLFDWDGMLPSQKPYALTSHISCRPKIGAACEGPRQRTAMACTLYACSRMHAAHHQCMKLACRR